MDSKAKKTNQVKPVDKKTQGLEFTPLFNKQFTEEMQFAER